MGELFNNPNEWVPLVSGRLIDFIRMPHLAGRRADAWPGRSRRCASSSACAPPGTGRATSRRSATPPTSISTSRAELRHPGGPAFTQAEQDVFPGCPELKDGYYWANDKPGLGIDLDEKLAAKFPIKDDPPFDYGWGRLRRRDGTIRRP